MAFSLRKTALHGICCFTGNGRIALVTIYAQARRSIVLGEVVPALGAVHIRDLHSAKTPPTHRSQLELALRTEMNARSKFRAAVWTRSHQRLSQQKVNHSPNAARHHYDNQHPQSSRHPPPLDVTADITHQQHIAGKRRPPRV